jgi:ATP-dependent helicase/DNAse subunit B
MILGSMLHQILENVYREVEVQDRGDPEVVVAVLPEAARRVFSQAEKFYGFRPSVLWDAQQNEFLEKLEKTIRELAKQGQGWIPVSFERRFGFGGSPFLRIKTDDGYIRLRGLIDRVDENQSGDLRVLDYKTGGSHLDKKSLLERRRLQLPLYALAVQDALKLGKPVEGIYWTILAGKASSLKLSKFEHEGYSGPEGAMEIVQEMVRDILAGIRSGKFPPRPPAGGCPNYCAASAWCWRNKPMRGWA